MKKRFKSKRKFKKQILFWIILFMITILVNIFYLDNISYSSIILKSGDVIKFDIDSKKILLKLGLNYDKEDEEVMVFSENEEDGDEELEEVIKPSIYLYNTHQSEEYADSGVFEMSKILKSKLEENGFHVTLEETDITSIIKKNNLAYKDSYKITRDLLTKALKEEYDLYIDVHRDSTKKEAATTTIDGKSYAKVMYVIGGKHDSYEENYNLVDKLNNITKNINNKLSRGIFVRKTSAYNQDLDRDIFLLEIGGPENTREEVSNTLDMLVLVLKNYFFE